MTSPERCSCGARDKNKCSKESEYKMGEMCLKESLQAMDKLAELAQELGMGYESDEPNN